MTDDTTFVRMIYNPTANRLAVTATTPFPPADSTTVIEVHPSAVEEVLCAAQTPTRLYGDKTDSPGSAAGARVHCLR